MEELPFSKKKQSKKPKKDSSVTSRKQERKQEKSDKFELNDKQVYEQIVQRSYDWIMQFHACEWCKKGQAEQMHHVIPRSRGGNTTLENVVYICLDCHMKKGHNL